MENLENSLILVVDDTPANLEVLSEALTDAGFEVGVATSGEGAIRQIEYNPPDLILLDVMMPGIDGFETCHRLKANPATHSIPVIFMTALSEPVDKVKGLSCGAVDYITKPFQQEEVLARVKTHLQLRWFAKTLETQNIQLKQLTETLEQKVEERTAELQKNQAQLIQHEKLSSLGQLVAGVAHEINNPLSCIAGNLAPAKEYVADMIQILELYQQHYPEPVPGIAEAAEAMDLNFALQDLPKILASMETGTERIREISRALRTFSRSDTSTCVAVDIHAGLDSTLLILHHRLKACGSRVAGKESPRPEIQVLKRYGNLPQVECYPGQLNQVFMNILSNAIEALEEAIENQVTPVPAPQICIQTELVDDQRVRIRIADNGAGMPEFVCQSLFEPFFTTKSVGKGTGLGMSISWKIITEKHRGTLQFSSAPGHGAEFTVEIPIRQS